MLVDAGAQDNLRQAHASRLLDALKAAIPEGERLAAIAREAAEARYLGEWQLGYRAYACSCC